ncbi:AAA family ATPase, partial [Streptomyces sp. NPDC056470]|uniref:AAA family ATPase n=1 Tax=Streptomyces sp. NPDC056470 TaxID=3345831 RepID=UPI0036A0C703
MADENIVAAGGGWPVLREAGVSTQVETGLWRLTGRAAELETFDAAWGTKSCRGFLIVGEAGVGKTRLAEECLAHAVKAGWQARRATASAAAAAVPLGAIAHLIPPGVDLSDPVKAFTDTAAQLSGAKRQRWAFLVDDLHLLDAASVVLLRQLMDAGIARVIATVRTGEPTNEAVTALSHDDTVRWLELDVLDQKQVERLLRVALGASVEQRSLHDLYKASGGNVLYLRELVLGALARGALTSDGEIWRLSTDRPVGTPRLAELVGVRLAAAAAEDKPVLELLALTEPLPLADAQQVAPTDVLADLESAGLIRTFQDRRRTTVALAHPLYGEVLRAGMVPM